MVFTFFPREAKRKPPFFTIFLSRLSPSVMKAVGNKAIAQFSLDHPMAGWTRPCRALRAARKPPAWARGRSRGVRDLVGRWVNADVANGHWFGSKEVDFLSYRIGQMGGEMAELAAWVTKYATLPAFSLST